jgi:hypothetical protein
MGLPISIAGVKFTYETPQELMTKIQKQIQKDKERRDGYNKKLLPLRKRIILFERTLKQFSSEAKPVAEVEIKK